MVKFTDKQEVELNSEVDSSQQTGFLQRWSLRKKETLSEIKNNHSSEYVDENSLTNISSDDISESVAEVETYKTDADMTPVEDLTEESSISDFLSPHVSDALRKQALRKLFHLPYLNVVDGLDDYAEDFTKFAALGNIIPHEMKRMLEREQAKIVADEQALAEQKSSVNQEEQQQDNNANSSDALESEIADEPVIHPIDNNNDLLTKKDKNTNEIIN